MSRVVRAAMFAGVCLSSAPAWAADPVTLPGVTVLANRNPGETPAEAAYGTALSQRLEKNASYPTGRDASVTCPSGTSTVWVEVTRAGKVVGHGIESSSKSQTLDHHAEELVARTKYQALPVGAWADGAAKHRFVVSYKFDCPAAKLPKKG